MARNRKESRLAVMKTLEEATTNITTPMLDIAITNDGETTTIRRYFKNRTDKQKYLNGIRKLGETLNV